MKAPRVGFGMFALTSVAAILMMTAAAASARADQKEATTSRSVLAGIPLPTGSRRITEPGIVEQISSRLAEMAAKMQRRSAFVEVLVWPDDLAGNSKAVAEALKSAGYSYEDRKVEDGAVLEARSLAAEKAGNQIVGFWIATEEYVLLAWSRLLDPTLDAVSSSPIPPQSSSALVPGEPPLTQEMAGKLHRLMEWLLDTPLTGEQRGALQQAMVRAWKLKDPAQMTTAQELLKLHDEVMALPSEKRSLVLAKAQPEIIRDLRKDKKSEMARWAVAIFDSSHKPIAQGNPPLTRQVCDAYTELIAFIVGEVTGRAAEPTRDRKNATAKTLIAGYGKLTPKQRMQLARFPMLWAAIRAAWPNAKEEERAELRKQWAGLLAKSTPQKQVSKKGETALRELEAMAPRVKSGELTAVELRYAAERMDIVAAELRRLGGAANKASADRWVERARDYRKRSESLASGGKSGDLKHTYERLMAQEMQRHNAYVGLCNASLTSHAGTLNMISIMSGSPYRYSVR